MLRDPDHGQFTDASDKAVIKPVIAVIAHRYAEYARSGSDAWDATIDVHGRPNWLKKLAGVPPGLRERAASLDHAAFARSSSAAVGAASMRSITFAQSWEKLSSAEIGATPADDGEDDDSEPAAMALQARTPVVDLDDLDTACCLGFAPGQAEGA